jgi:hypothetical protein
MSNEIKVGDWTITPTAIQRLHEIHATANGLREMLDRRAVECCEILGIDPAGCSLAKDFAEEIVLTGTPVEEAIRNIQAYQEAGR